MVWIGLVIRKQTTMNAAVQRVESTSISTASSTRAPQTRDGLLLMATERFCGETISNRLSNEQYKEAFYLLIGEVQIETKKRIAASICDCDYVPRSIAMYFALEPQHLSQSVLLTSKTLGQLDLLRIAEMKRGAHATLIAQRADIGPTLFRRLKELNIESVDAALAKNYFLPKNIKNKKPQDTFDLIDKQVRTSPPAEKQNLSNAENSLLAAASRGGRLTTQSHQEEASYLAFDDFGQTFEQAVIRRSRQAMIVLMGKQAGISQQTANQILDDKSGDTLAVFLCSAGVGAAQANRIQLLNQPSIGLSVQNAMRAVRFYAELKKDTCVAAVDMWPKGNAAGAKHQAFHEEGNPLRRDVEHPLEQTANETLSRISA